jgi:hypothetical protein
MRGENLKKYAVKIATPATSPKCRRVHNPCFYRKTLALTDAELLRLEVDRAPANQ